ncbi:aldo/keto reductase [Sulfurifustis variabilis]|uniref:Aldo/keto reductase n=1 Tax=Sulfurifustis variabilis TaxID=1675686 RepID=A0A1B4V547_9GAMM|nr:aldo/keto reductase [Sulfurifustis variabilis]BAU47662.1 aldo/keto reductase [Sulfurifustis variabilis]
MTDVRLSRRAMLRLLLASAPLAAGVRPARAAGEPMTQRTIPVSGERIPVIGLGTWQTFDVGPAETERAPLREVLRLFLAHGGRVVDSSPMYGSAESVLGDLAAELRAHDRLFLATKVWTGGEAAGVRQMEESLERMRARRLDLVQVHNLLDWRTHLKTLRAWKEQGRVRYLGVTHYTASAYEELERVMESEPLDFVQLNYSIAEREAERRLLPLARERGIAVLANRPFAKAGLFRRVRGRALPAWAAEFDCASWAQFFLKFVIGHPAVTCAIPATSNPKHAVDNMQAGYGRLPDGAMRQRMAERVRQL